MFLILVREKMDMTNKITVAKMQYSDPVFLGDNFFFRTFGAQFFSQLRFWPDDHITPQFFESFRDIFLDAFVRDIDWYFLENFTGDIF